MISSGISGVRQAVHLAQGDVGGLVFGQVEHIVAVGDFGGAGHPALVFSTIVVFLQAAASFSVVLDALDFEAAAFLDTVVPAPRACTLRYRMAFGFLALQKA